MMNKEQKLLAWLKEMGANIHQLCYDEDGAYIMDLSEGESGEEGWMKEKQIRVPNEYL